MKLFGYYALHTFKNQLKKLFKTWVLIFIAACFALGLIIGMGAVMISDLAGEDDIPAAEEVAEEEVAPINVEEQRVVIELIVGGVVLTILFFCVIGSDKNGSSIFLPADVNLLFASPLKPQSVLLFRLTTQLGAIVLSSLYLCFQIPNLVLNMGFGAWVALAAVGVWIFTIVIGKLLQMLIYTVSSTHTKFKRYIRLGAYSFIALIAIVFLLYVQITRLDYYTASKAFFNSPISRFIPIWGWLKAMVMCCIEGNTIGIIASICALIIGGVLLAIIIWRVKADFYEDAMAKSQETAEQLYAAQNTGMVKRKKDRSERIARDGMTKGSGANVFFHRSLYNRFRFAHLGIFTKTSETYLALSAVVCVICRFVVKTKSVIPAMLAISVFVFFRTLGNPLAEDTSRDFFRLIPERTFDKLFYSVAGGSVNCLMDILPALVVAVIILGANPLYVIAWIPFILSVDFYGTNTGAFIDLSLQISAGKMIKQIVQIMFIYFGLIPDVIIMAIGIILGVSPITAIIAAVLNFGLGMLFLALTPLFIDYKDKGRA